jgi:hypothetical protein
LEVVPSEGGFGEAFGTVGGLIAGIADNHGQLLLDGAARRMRALTGFDRVTLTCGGQRAESSRGSFAGPPSSGDLSPIICDTGGSAVPIFPRENEDEAARSALLRAPDPETLDGLEAAGIRSLLRVPFSGGGSEGEFRCESRTPRGPSFEIHAAAELFAQMVALRLEMDQLREGAALQPAK